MGNFCLMLLLLWLFCFITELSGEHIINGKNDFTVADKRLISNWLVYTNSQLCDSLNVIDYLSKEFTHLREIGRLSVNYATDFFDIKTSDSTCNLACVDVGSPIDLVDKIFPERKFSIEQVQYNVSKLTEWFFDECVRREFGLISSRESNVALYWIEPGSFERHYIGEIEPGEPNTFWQTTSIGHEFSIVDPVTEEELNYYTIMHDAIYLIGDLKSGINKDYVPEGFTSMESAIEDGLGGEWQKMKEVKRTFTAVGFQKSRLPSDLFASMSAFYYNNRHNIAKEEWDDIFVNWWENDTYMINMPWKLKKYWQSRLKDLVEVWSNTTLEMTDIYGMRQYNEGARLLTHVDRITTHAASLIINVAQGNVAKPWPVEIYDHANRLHEIVMEEGDIVYYESAKCLHGRMRPLEGAGSYYVNLFAHYRPVDDPEWYLKETPSDHEQPLIDLTGVDIATKLSSLSPTREQLHDENSLFLWWKRVSPTAEVSSSQIDEL